MVLINRKRNQSAKSDAVLRTSSKRRSVGANDLGKSFSAQSKRHESKKHESKRFELKRYGSRGYASGRHESRGYASGRHGSKRRITVKMPDSERALRRRERNEKRTRHSFVKSISPDELKKRRVLGKPNRSHKIKIAIAAATTLVVAALIGAIILFNSNLCMIESVTTTGSTHLTEEEIKTLANVYPGDTLFRVNTDEIRSRLLKDAWIEDVTIEKHFPNTLHIVIKERAINAVVDVMSSENREIRKWAIASDGMWLMPIPDQNSEAGQAISQQIYADLESVTHITNVSYGPQPEIGTYCTDKNIKNALDIMKGLSTSLAPQIKSIQATDDASSTLVLENGIEVVFGDSKNIRDKERVCLSLLEKYEGRISYINVKIPDSPTWRSI